MPVPRHRELLAILVAASLAAISGCSAYAPPPRAFHKAALEPYRLDAGDRVRITVFEQAGLSNTYTVDQVGYIAFPLIGQVAGRGRTVPAVEADIAARLKKGYLREPDVSIEIDRYRPVFVMGEVGRPGQYSYLPGMTAQNAVAVAGGFTPRGEQRNVDVTRRVNREVVTGRITTSEPLLAGDTIYVRERLF